MHGHAAITYFWTDEKNGLILDFVTSVLPISPFGPMEIHGSLIKIESPV